MPRAEIPEGVELLKPVTGETLENGWVAHMQPSPKFGAYISVADIPKLHQHWLEQLKEELLSAESLRTVARRRHEAEHADGFDDRAYNDLPVGRQLRAMDEAKRDLLLALAARWSPTEEGGDA